jgi:PleD family two-component response regulator
MSWDTLLKALPTLCNLVQMFRGRKPNRGTILVVEDGPADALILLTELKRVGYECEIAETAELARSLIGRSFYQIVFVDLRLPGMSGQEFLRVLQEESPESKPVIICGEPSDMRGYPPGEPFICIIKNVHVKGLRKLFKDLNVK